MLDFIGDVLGAIMDQGSASKARKSNERSAALDRQMQLDFAQKGIGWKVADAKAAGVHPLAALGVMPSNYTPVGMHYEPSSSSGDIFRALGRLGQDLTRPRMAGQTAKERSAEVSRLQPPLGFMEKTANALSLERMQLENEELRARIGRLNSAQLGPSVPSPAAPGAVEVVPDQVVVGDVGAPERSPGVLTDYAFGRTARGYTVVPSLDMKQRIEDMPQEWTWFLRNGLTPPSSVYAELTRRHPPAPGMVWQYNAFTSEFTQVPRRDAGRRAWQFFFRPDLYADPNRR